MNFFKVKFFPSKLEDYLYFCLSNIIFLITFIYLIHKNIDENSKIANMGEIMLFIPKIGSDYEEKRDLIFNQLSANSLIISVNKLENNEIKKLLSDLLKNIKVSDDIIPDVYDVKVEKSKPLNLTLINNKIKKIIPGALLKELNYKKKNISIYYFTIFIILIFITLLNNFFLVKNILIKIKNYINLSRYFGVNDAVIIRNFNISFFVLLSLVFLFSYLIFKMVLKKYLYLNLLNNFFIIYLVICFIYSLIILTIFSIQCKMYMKKLNVL